jgi:hypothetical protein
MCVNTVLSKDEIAMKWEYLIRVGNWFHKQILLARAKTCQLTDEKMNSSTKTYSGTLNYCGLRSRKKWREKLVPGKMCTFINSQQVAV